MSKSKQGGVESIELLQLEDGGKYQSQATIPGQLGKALVVIEKGTYKVENGLFSVTLEDVDWKFVGVTPDQEKSLTDQFKKTKSTLIKEANKNPASTLKWRGSDSFTLVSKGETVLYVRAKE